MLAFTMKCISDYPSFSLNNKKVLFGSQPLFSINNDLVHQTTHYYIKRIWCKPA